MPPTTGGLTDVEDLRSRLDEVLARHLDGIDGELSRISVDAASLADELPRVVQGGKRLRAAFCYWSWRAHGGDPRTPAADAVLGVAAALELFQAAALIHDDLMDRSDTRRGRPTPHRAFERVHRDADWEGDAAAFGANGAILLGDLTLIASEQAFQRSLGSLPAEAGARAREVFDLMRVEVTAGQYLDVLAQALPWGDDPTLDERRAREVIRAKSARYSVEHPVVIGAALAGGDDRVLAAAGAFGLPVGEAFQLRDDLLGVFGDPQTTGKPAGDDLREGKRTVLIARALATADAAGRELIRSRVGRADLDEGQIDELRDLLIGSGAVEEVERLIATLSETAAEALDAADLAPEGRRMLESLATAAVQRVL